MMNQHSHTTHPETLHETLARRDHPRYWWHTCPTHTYEPDIYRLLDAQQRQLILDWYEQTHKDNQIGEMAVPMASIVLSFINASGLTAIVQLGHYVGFSTLLLGWALQRMHANNALFSIDLKETFTSTTQHWLDKANLNDIVKLHTADSADRTCVDAACRYLGCPPTCIIIDSSHQYQHTLAELTLWYDALAPGGLIFLHDASPMAARYDRTNQGGVRRALDEWLADDNWKTTTKPQAMTLLGPPAHSTPAPYADPSGLCLIQKPPMK